MKAGFGVMQCVCASSPHDWLEIRNVQEMRRAFRHDNLVERGCRCNQNEALFARSSHRAGGTGCSTLMLLLPRTFQKTRTSGYSPLFP